MSTSSRYQGQPCPKCNTIIKYKGNRCVHCHQIRGKRYILQFGTKIYFERQLKKYNLTKVRFEKMIADQQEFALSAKLFLLHFV